jgi:hypothetical protein
MMTTIDILAMAKRARAATRTIATSTTAISIYYYHPRQIQVINQY